MAADPTGISSSDPGPQEAESDGQRMKAHSLPDQIARDQYLAAKAAASQAGFGLRFNKLIAPGAISSAQPDADSAGQDFGVL